MTTRTLTTALAFCMAVATAQNLAAQDCDGNGIPDVKEIAASSYKDSNRNGVLDLCEGFSVDLDELSLSNGGTQRLHLNLGPNMVGKLFWVLGSTDMSSGGLTFGAVKFPLSWDGVNGYMHYTLKAQNDGFLTGSIGYLNGKGQATARFNVPSSTDPSLAGLNVYHAYMLLTSDAAAVTWSSNAVRVELVP